MEALKGRRVIPLQSKKDSAALSRRACWFFRRTAVPPGRASAARLPPWQ